MMNDMQFNCNDEMQQKVLGVADGTITKQNEIDAVMEHLTKCTACRKLYEDFFEIAIDDEEVNEDYFGIDLEFKDNTFIALSPVQGLIQPAVQVLAQTNVPVIELEYPYKNSIIRIKIIYTNQQVDIALNCTENGIKIYLLTGSKFDVATIDNNTAYFSSIEPGTIVLLFEFKKIVKIHIKI
jgi:hypothetical protein